MARSRRSGGVPTGPTAGSATGPGQSTKNISREAGVCEISGLSPAPGLTPGGTPDGVKFREIKLNSPGPGNRRPANSGAKYKKKIREADACQFREPRLRRGSCNLIDTSLPCRRVRPRQVQRRPYLLTVPARLRRGRCNDVHTSLQYRRGCGEAGATTSAPRYSVGAFGDGRCNDTS